MTIFTLVPKLEVTKKELCASLSYFPLVGLILGAIVAGLNWSISQLWAPFLKGAVLVTGLAFLTRGLHLDGFCDVADAIGSGADRKKALEIMKDSRTGSLGVLALVCLMMLKMASMSSLADKMAWQFLILSPCLSRWSLNCLSSLSVYARESEGLGSPFCGKKTYPTLVISSLTAIASAWFLLGLTGLYLFVFSIFLAFFSSFFFKRRFGGITGDCLGAHLETVETIFFMIGAYCCR